MVKIVSRKSLGIQPVYDIGVERAHNFALRNGTIASNCFNKSHSTAYAYVTYQTAYLKANYTTEYMAALLTANSGDQDKVKKYLANCQSMAIEVEPPDINRSDVEFTPLINKKIVFGLSAIKNVGEGAIENILKVRKEGGPFKSLGNLCERIDLRAVNSRTLESLIKCGALDKINPNRKQLIADLELVVKWAQNKEKERESGQTSLFDLLGISGDTNKFEEAPKATQIDDFPQKEKLQFEKELLGLYVSTHPLKNAAAMGKHLDPAPITLNELQEKKKKHNKVNVVVLLTEVKKITTKRDNRQMAFLQMEDLEGQAEAVVFPDIYDQFKELLIPEQPLIVSGKVEVKDDKPQIIVDKVEWVKDEPIMPVVASIEIEAEPPLQNEESEEEYVSMVLLQLTPQEVQDGEKMKNLKVILGDYTAARDSGKVPVVAMVVSGDQRRFIEFGLNYRVEQYESFVSRLKDRGFDARVSPLQER
ncbi:OB-fold nucleic acid binding domain-containing protein [Ancylothrix sp. C2]|uniref:helix-hairpin-helix domain-containing protein n=1 Tax=Ancylothrix sp. D3o TaxID=2953691 RepID=UPI0021BA45A6|nr:OB-fold nucleic acid binding domain-containing protein [Ancylothrix sp. D3o]MCT7950266.1 OB-fold nucleic acid binding domain-containing protein [Ancylothrix sp. D3o]